MIIAIDVAAIRPNGEVGGAMHHAIELIKGFNERHKEHHYILLTGDWNHQFFKQFESAGIEILCVAHKPSIPNISRIRPAIVQRIFYWVKRKINRILPQRRNRHKFILKEKGVDILFCPLSAITYAQPGVATVSVVNDIQHEYYPQFFTADELNHRRNFYREICEGADAVVCISDFTKRSLIDRLNFPEEKAFVNYISIHERLLDLNEDTDINSVLNNLGIRNTQYAYYPANFWPHKNHKILITAFSMFRNRYPHVDLHLVFTGALIDQYDDIKSAVKQMGIQDVVHFLGYLPEKDIAAVMSGASFIVFPSLFEGFGIPVLEAMSFGKPVLCSNVTSLPEVGGEAAVFFDPRKPDQICDAMWRITSDNEFRHTCVEKGFSHIRNFSRIKMIDTYMEIFMKVCQAEKKDVVRMDGLFSDGWSGSVLCLLAGNSPKPRKYQIGFQYPVHKPGVKASIVVMVNGKKQREYKVKKNQEIIIEGTISHGSVTEIVIDPVFCPGDLGSQDQRELGLMVTKALVIDVKKQKAIKNFLFPEENQYVI